MLGLNCLLPIHVCVIVIVRVVGTLVPLDRVRTPVLRLGLKETCWVFFKSLQTVITAEKIRLPVVLVFPAAVFGSTSIPQIGSIIFTQLHFCCQLKEPEALGSKVRICCRFFQSRSAFP
jgi:hypothetical protein